MFDWDEANISHLAEHDVLPSEAEEVITNNPLDVNYEMRNGEPRFRQVGETTSGRILLIVSTERNGLTRVITGHPPSPFLLNQFLTYRTEFTHDREENAS